MNDFWRFFARMPDVEVLSEFSGRVDRNIRHRPQEIDSSRAVDVTGETVMLNSSYVFWGCHESQVYISQLGPYIPLLTPHLQQMVDQFSSEYLKNAVGFHLRRTDNRWAIRQSPDFLFINKGREIVAAGKKIFLATDNERTERKMKRYFGSDLITYQKRTLLEKRWPRATKDDVTVVEDDLIDLFLLSRTEYILGSSGSSFSGVAMALNGSSQSSFLTAEVLDWSGRIELLRCQLSRWRLVRKKFLKLFR
jgi:hypothetical protein